MTNAKTSGKVFPADALHESDLSDQLQSDYETAVREMPNDKIPAEMLLELNAQTAILATIATALVSAVKLMTMAPHARDAFDCNDDGELTVK